ncbi:MAG: response regulator [Proteobacteria bacterium]|nr:response regulator [Pseudomonadota bacterium]
MTQRRILLVEDEELARCTLVRVLETQGYDVTSLDNGAAAVTCLAAERFDVVTTDLVMEGLDGVQVLREAKKRDPDACVVVVSGYCDVDSAIDALRLGAEDYLAKPFDYDELLLRVARCVEKRELRRRLRLYEDILPICAGCRRIRDDAGVGPGNGPWVGLEDYLARRTGARMSQGCCPECASSLQKRSDLSSSHFVLLRPRGI